MENQRLVREIVLLTMIVNRKHRECKKETLLKGEVPGVPEQAVFQNSTQQVKNSCRCYFHSI